MIKVGALIPENAFVRLANDSSVGEVSHTSPKLLHIWSISCPSCKSNMPHLHKLRDQFATHGLQTFAIHMPRGEGELDEEKVRAVADEIGVIELLLFDNDHEISETLGAHAVPAYFLFDAEGKLRRHALGNFGVRIIGEVVKRLFGDTEPVDETRTAT